MLIYTKTALHTSCKHLHGAKRAGRTGRDCSIVTMTPLLDCVFEKPLVQKITMSLLYMHKSPLSINNTKKTPQPHPASKKRMPKELGARWRSFGFAQDRVCRRIWGQRSPYPALSLLGKGFYDSFEVRAGFPGSDAEQDQGGRDLPGTSKLRVYESF